MSSPILNVSRTFCCNSRKKSLLDIFRQDWSNLSFLKVSGLKVSLKIKVIKQQKKFSFDTLKSHGKFEKSLAYQFLRGFYHSSSGWSLAKLFSDCYLLNHRGRYILRRIPKVKALWLCAPSIVTSLYYISNSLDVIRPTLLSK